MPDSRDCNKLLLQYKEVSDGFSKNKCCALQRHCRGAALYPGRGGGGGGGLSPERVWGRFRGLLVQYLVDNEQISSYIIICTLYTQMEDALKGEVVGRLL